MAMSTVTRPAESLPVAGDDIDAEPYTNYVTNILAFLESATLKGGNVNTTDATDGIVTLGGAQTIGGTKSFTRATFTAITAIERLITMQGIPLYVTAGETLAAGDLVYVSAWDSTNSCFTVSKAVATAVQATTLYARYVATAIIASGAQGTVYSMNVLSNQNTTGLTAGRPVWLSATSGLWTGTIPAGGILTQIVGFVVTVHASAGRVAIELPGQIVPWSLSDAQV